MNQLAAITACRIDPAPSDVTEQLQEPGQQIVTRNATRLSRTV
jgi:hypothetical protein